MRLFSPESLLVKIFSRFSSTPITVNSLPPIWIVFPMGFMFGKNLSAMADPITATGCRWVFSQSVKKRPCAM